MAGHGREGLCDEYLQSHFHAQCNGDGSASKLTNTTQQLLISISDLMCTIPQSLKAFDSRPLFGPVD